MRKILLAEDDEDVRALLCAMLARAGYRTEAYCDGRAALDAALNKPFSLYLLDVRMPEMGGLELCRRLKTDPRTKARPVLLVSAESSDEDIAAGSKRGPTLTCRNRSPASNCSGGSTRLPAAEPTHRMRPECDDRARAKTCRAAVPVRD